MTRYPDRGGYMPTPEDRRFELIAAGVMALVIVAVFSVIAYFLVS